MKILVIGGRGFWGGHVARALSAIPNSEVKLGSRSGAGDTVKIDLNDPATFPAMDAFDYVVNCSDAVDASPLDAIRYALDRPKPTFVDTVADPAAIEQVLHAIRRHPGAPQDARPGRVILGLGLMPGVSNMVARSLLGSNGKASRLEVAVRSSSFAGGGRGMVVLMVRCMLRNSVRYEGGQRVEDPPVSDGIVVPFGHTDKKTARLGLPEAPMLHWSTGVPSTATYIAPEPGFMLYTLKGLSKVVPKSEAGKKRFYDTMVGSFTFQRATLLRKVPTSIEVTAIMDREGKGKVIGPHLTLHAEKGIEAGAYAIAAGIWLIEQGHPVPTGLHLPDEAFPLHPIMESVEKLSGGTIKMELRS